MPHYSHPNNPLQIAEQTAFVFRRWMDGGYAKESPKRLGLRRLPRRQVVDLEILVIGLVNFVSVN